MGIQQLIGYVQDFEVFIIIAIVLAVFAFRKKIITLISRELGLKDLRRDLIKNTIMLNVHNVPFKAEVIETDYKEYKELGGNGYMDNTIKEWRRSYENALIAKRIGTWDGKDRRGQRTTNERGNDETK